MVRADPTTVSSPTPTKTTVNRGEKKMNVIAMMMDDTGMCQMPQYDDQNRWPGSYPYPNMAFTEEKYDTNQCVRFTRATVNARCSPTRASIMTGLLPHINDEHPQGTGIGDVPGQTPDATPFWEGLKAAHRPWPAVATTAGTEHAMGSFGKWHLYEYLHPEAVQNYDSLVTVAGFDESHMFELSGGGEPLYGYYNFDYIKTASDGTVTTEEAVASTFSPTMEVEKLLGWIDEQVVLDKPFFVNWWMNMPHGTLPPIDQAIGPDLGLLYGGASSGASTLHSTYTQAQLGYSPGVYDPADSGGLVTVTGPPMTLYDIDGNNPATVATGLTGYTSEGGYNTIHRRAISMFEAMDSLIEIVSDYVETQYPEVFERTVFMLYSDNGAATTALAPIYTNEHVGLGSEYTTTIPPTSDGTTTGTPYHDKDNQKGTVHDDGIKIPFLVWGDPIPVTSRGKDCLAMTDATDIYCTFLDFVAYGTWQSALGASDLATRDGESFFSSLFDAKDAGKDYIYSMIFQPGGINDTLDDGDALTYYHQSVRNSDNWKLTRETGNAFMLFDLDNDANEETNLYASTDPTAVLNRTDLITPYLAKFGGSPID